MYMTKLYYNNIKMYVCRTFGIVQNMVNSEGIRAFWKGTLPTLIRNVPGKSSKLNLV